MLFLLRQLGVKKMEHIKDWKEPKDAFLEWQRVSRGRLCDYSGMSYEKIEKLGGIQWPFNEENPNGTKRLYGDGMVYSTEDGKPRFICAEWIPMEENLCESFPLILNTGRTVEQFHTRTKTGSISILDNLAPKAWIELNPKDAQKLKVKSGERIAISSPRGRVEDVIVKITEGIREGNIFVPFHFNKQLVNCLTQSLFDPKSFEPNFKQTAVQLHSIKVPKGIKIEKEQIAGSLGYEKVIKVKGKVNIKSKIVDN